MDDNSSAQVITRLASSIQGEAQASAIDEFGMKSDLFNGYTWPGWITMAMCFLGASTNIFHVSTESFSSFYIYDESCLIINYERDQKFYIPFRQQLSTPN